MVIYLKGPDVDKVLIFEETIKKSKFITYIGRVENKSDLEEFINKYRRIDARHNCWAYKYGYENPKYGYNNDGEPIGTAGEPLLRLIEVNKLTNIIIFCVRYYGGIKLGTGGLQRAYSNGAIQLLKEMSFSILELKFSLKISFNISHLKKITTYLHKLSIKETTKEFWEDTVVLDFFINDLELLNPISNEIEIISKKYDYY